MSKMKEFFVWTAKQILAVIVFIVVVGVFVQLYFDEDDINNFGRPKSDSWNITATDLWTEYAENEVRADIKYKGKTIYVKGNLIRVSKTFFGKIEVSLDASRAMGLSAELSDGQEDLIAEKSHGDLMVLQCICGGGSVLSIPILSECVVK